MYLVVYLVLHLVLHLVIMHLVVLYLMTLYLFMCMIRHRVCHLIVLGGAASRAASSTESMAHMAGNMVVATGT